MLKGVDRINKFLNNWLQDNGFECTVQLDTDFHYDIINDVIHYSLVVPMSHDELFLSVCQECRPEIGDCDNFIVSFFHELGHFNTYHLFDDKEIDLYDSICESIYREEALTDEEYDTYYHCDVELEATQWGCDYIVEHSDEIEEWWKTLKQLILDFYEINNIEME